MRTWFCVLLAISHSWLLLLIFLFTSKDCNSHHFLASFSLLPFASVPCVLSPSSIALVVHTMHEPPQWCVQLFVVYAMPHISFSFTLLWSVREIWSGSKYSSAHNLCIKYEHNTSTSHYGSEYFQLCSCEEWIQFQWNNWECTDGIIIFHWPRTCKRRSLGVYTC